MAPSQIGDRVTVIGIVMASDKDLETMSRAARWLAERGIPVKMTAMSPAREPDMVRKYALEEAPKLKVIIAGSGGTNELAMMIANYTLTPVLAVPLRSADGTSVTKETAAVLSTQETPPGLAIATFGLDAVENAAMFAAQILLVSSDQEDKRVETILKRYRKDLAGAAAEKRRNVERANESIQGLLAPAPTRSKVL